MADSKNKIFQDTIIAQATAAGRCGVSIIRISGAFVKKIAKKILGKIPKPRYATSCNFLSSDCTVIDNGIAIYFASPNSFTGEDVLELHCHGNPFIIDLLLNRVLELGARLANPGEFTQRAFLNKKIDLAQAEAIADLINSSTEQAAKNATKSLQGAFSNVVNNLITNLIEIRTKLEASIDFAEEDFIIKPKQIKKNIADLLLELQTVTKIATNGAILQDGITVAIVGRPNVGKSSLFNYLNGSEKAIVSNIAGTTRDVLHSHIQLDGLAINLIDTAGLNQSPDIIEQEGIRRAIEQAKTANHILLINDVSTINNEKDIQKLRSEFLDLISKNSNLTILHNKIDLTEYQPKLITKNNIYELYLSIKTKIGLDLLKQHIKTTSGLIENSCLGGFSARRRHIDALKTANKSIRNASKIINMQNSYELAAEDLRQAQLTLEEITGKFTSNDLLSKIFKDFCIGK